MSQPAPPLKIAEIHGRGRSLVAAEPLIAGQVILRESPILVYSAQPLQHTTTSYSYCLNCFKSLNPTTTAQLQRCPSNPSHVFCSPTCLTVSSSSSHSSWACQALTTLQNCPHLLEQSTEVQSQARFLVSAYNLSVLSPDDFRVLLSLQGGVDDVDGDLARFLHSVVLGFCGPWIPGFSVELTAVLLAKDKINAFGLMEPFSEEGERSVRGYGVYPKASFFNHDCLPNACRFDYVDGGGDGIGSNVDIVVRMIHDVPEGREICLSYFPVNMGYKDRQKRLKEDYGFVCECDRCRVEANWSDDEEEEGDGDGDEEEEGMEEDEGHQMVGLDNGVGGEEGDNDFPHAYFFVRYMCSRDNCGGTLAPLPPSPDGRLSNVMECNVCGRLKNADDEFDCDGGEDSHLMDE